jgi:hypothetical protein
MPGTVIKSAGIGMVTAGSPARRPGRVTVWPTVFFAIAGFSFSETRLTRASLA